MCVCDDALYKSTVTWIHSLPFLPIAGGIKSIVVKLFRVVSVQTCCCLNVKRRQCSYTLEAKWSGYVLPVTMKNFLKLSMTFRVVIKIDVAQFWGHQISTVSILLSCK